MLNAVNQGLDNFHRRGESVQGLGRTYLLRPMTVSGENLADWFRDILVVCQYEQGLGNPHSEDALRLRQRFTERAAERADVNSIGGSAQGAAGEEAAGQVADRLGG